MNDGNLPLSTTGGAGRKGNNGITETPKIGPLKKEAPRLLRLFKKVQKATDDYKADVNRVAEANNANAGTLHKLIKSSAKGNFEDKRRAAEQESIIFTGVGEVKEHAEAGE